MNAVMTFNRQMVSPNSDDVSLVAASVAGNKDAFAQIVGRYQALICSLAYSATGNLSQSEDLAQETFVTAWKQLGHLREPERLRSWLCGIARNLSNSAVRQRAREPLHGAETMETMDESPAVDLLPAEQAISNEEQAILWRSLEKIPETYREPLILFYREHQSIERVAAELELSEDAVKQRLSRGRKLLSEQVTAFVEGALKQSTPGRAFTVGVLAALPSFTASANAAALGVSAAKGGATAKAAGLTGLFGVLCSLPVAIFGNWVGYRMSLDLADSDPERRFIKTFYRRLVGSILGFFLGYGLLMYLGPGLQKTNPGLVTKLTLGLVLAHTIVTIALFTWVSRRQRQLVAALTPGQIARSPSPAREYLSQGQFLGLPFYHIRIGGGLAHQRKVVKGWIAAGDCAVGGLFAFGGLAIAPISIGGCAVGLFPFGGFALGLLALGGFSIGAWSFGGLALGWEAFGGCAVAWNAAVGGAAVAHNFALGGLAQAAQVNNETAAMFVRGNPFFYYGQMLLRHMAWMNLIWVVPMIVWWRAIRRHAGKR